MRNKTSLLLLGLLLILFSEECSARRGGGGGGSRGGGGGRSRGGGGGWFSRGGSSSSSSRGKTSGSRWSSKSSSSHTLGNAVIGGRNVYGTYKTFGKPNRWSLYRGRSFYYVGRPYGHYYHGGYQSSESQTGLMNPWVTMILILSGINLVGLTVWSFVYCMLD